MIVPIEPLVFVEYLEKDRDGPSIVILINIFKYEKYFHNQKSFFIDYLIYK